MFDMFMDSNCLNHDDIARVTFYSAWFLFFFSRESVRNRKSVLFFIKALLPDHHDNTLGSWCGHTNQTIWKIDHFDVTYIKNCVHNFTSSPNPNQIFSVHRPKNPPRSFYAEPYRKECGSLQSQLPSCRAVSEPLCLVVRVYGGQTVDERKQPSKSVSRIKSSFTSPSPKGSTISP